MLIFLFIIPVFLSLLIAGIQNIMSKYYLRYILVCIYLCVLLYSTVILFYFMVAYSMTIHFYVMRWLSFSLLSIDWCIYLDPLSISMLLVVICISIVVHIYSFEYMRFDIHKFKFIGFLSLFTFFMVILIISSNYLQLFVGWEGVGLCSYLLISFWNSRIQANKSAIKAMLVNRIGDFGLMLSFLFVYFFFKSFNFFVIFPSVLYFVNTYVFFFDAIYLNLYSIVCFFIFVGAVGKSAQFGLHVWLPDAMEGPTPVSALIHAATMVTAGVFLIIRSSYIFEFSPVILYVITLIGAITAFYAATIGLVQNDIKRVVAFSTCSQLGYMVLSCGLSNYSVSLFHLFTHAFFKALLFLSAGCVIHSLFNEQDMRKMGGLRFILPFTYSMFLIGSLALIGFPFLSGFYSKDLILELAFSKYTFSSHFAYWLGTFSALFTAFYSFRLLCLVFLSRINLSYSLFCTITESSTLMLFSIFMLSVLSIFVGFLFRDLIVGVGSFFFCNSIFNLSYNLVLLDSELLPVFIRLLPFVLSLIGCLVAFVLYIFFEYALYYIRVSYFGKVIYVFLNRRWFVDKIYCEVFSQNFLIMCYYTIYFYIDRGFLEKMGSMLFSKIISILGYLLDGMFSGFFIDYIYFFLFFFCIYIVYFCFFINILLFVNLIFGFLVCCFICI